jgi:GxxExxY protein
MYLLGSGSQTMSFDEESLERDPQTYAIIGACMAVHRELGPGFLEPVYQEALAIEFTRRNIPFVREKPLVIRYLGQQLATRYDADFYCYDSIILELKALSELVPKHHAQVLNYLKATDCERGLLVNFGAPRLEYKRVILTRAASRLK